MDDAIRAGAALWDGGAYRAARTAWETDGAADGVEATARRGLAALATATALARDREGLRPSGSRDAERPGDREASSDASSSRAQPDDGEAVAGERADRAAAALVAAADDDDLADSAIDFDAARAYAAALADADAVAAADLTDPPTLARGDSSERGVEVTARAAAALSATDARYDERTIERATAYAREELADGERTETLFTALLFDFVDEAARRGLVYRRLEEHVERRERRRRDVDGLFG